MGRIFFHGNTDRFGAGEADLAELIGGPAVGDDRLHALAIRRARKRKGAKPKQKQAIGQSAVVESAVNGADMCDAPRTDFAHFAGLAIADLGLVDYAQDAAAALLAAHSNVVFTSGRRSVKQQADAMAENIVQNRQYIVQTYAANPESRSLQQWVDDHPEATSKAAISTGLEDIMRDWTDAQKKTLSRHFSGQAFDVQPVDDGGAIEETIKSLPNLRQFSGKQRRIDQMACGL
jgi:hypothetical protein